ncbi:MAG: methyltransferase domain-containing protein, partial [Verrucomicrobia bacterium]|nr:methyltransferase domain-containing protein [Verrucomicrobiota bacterium]
AGLKQIRFEQAAVQNYSSDESFDVVIGRYILHHQSDPVDFLRSAARLVRPGGGIAFHEIRVVQTTDSLPYVPLWQLAGNLIEMACRSGLPHYDVSNRLIECFFEAGLPQPHLFCETLIGGGIDSPLYAWMAESLRSFLPQLAKIGFALGEPGVLEAFEDNLRAAVVEARSQIVAPAQVCCWTRM